MRLEWEQDIPADASLGELTAFLPLVADCCQLAEGVPLSCAVHVLLTGDERIRRVNAEQRGIDRATDVLSFPTVSYAAGRTARHSLPALKREFDPDAGGCMLGDILISLPHAVAQAAMPLSTKAQPGGEAGAAPVQEPSAAEEPHDEA